MKKRIVSLVLFLSVILSVLALASCGGGGADETSPVTEAATAPATEKSTEPATEAVTAPATEKSTEPATEPATETATEPETEPETEPATTVDPELKWEKIASDLSIIVAKDRNLIIECCSNETASKASKNDIYLQGPDALVDGVTPAIQVKVYKRNRAAEDLLNMSTKFVYWDDGWGNQAGRIDTVVKGNDPEAPDLFVNMIYDLNKELLNSTFKDVRSIPKGCFDFSASGWLKEWMDSMSLTGDRAYLLASDYFLDVFRALTLLPFNMSMMDENADKLAQAILGEEEELEPGEALTPYFFDLVEQGGWTWDVLGKLSAAIYVDDDGDGQDSIGDILGIIADENQGYSAGGFVYSCGEKLIETYVIEDESSPYNNKQWIKYADDSSGLSRIFDEVKAVFDGRGTVSTNASPSGNSASKPGLAYHHTLFADGRLLFAGVNLLGTLEKNTFQEMDDTYSIVPCPKTDVANSYNTIVYNTGNAGAINVNTNPRKARILSAYLQYCSEHSAEIRDDFLQIVTKYKTVTYDQGTDRMLDLIYSTILYGRDKAIDDLIGEVGGARRWHSIMKLGHFSVGSDDIASEYSGKRGTKQSALDATLETWYTLPKS